MALINKIRERSGIAVAVIAVALLLFIVGGDIFSGAQGGGSLFGGSTNTIGEIAGKDIDYQQFMSEFEKARANYEAQAQRAATEQEIQQIREQVWEQFIFNVAYTEEFEKMGLTVTADELREMIQGTKNLHPYVRQQFTNPQTGQYDRNQHMQFINAIANNQLPAEQKAAWDSFKEQLIQVRLREKFENLLGKSIHVTSIEAKSEYVAQNEKLSANYLFVPFYSVLDSTIKVTDSQLSDYFNKHKDEFKGFDSRSLDYVVFQIAPTKEDSSYLNNDIRELAKGLASATDPQEYAVRNSDVRFALERPAGDVSAELKAAVSQTIVGATIGPFKEGNTYSIHKYLGTSKDSLYTVRASHILIGASKDSPDSVRAEAKRKANEVLAQAKQGVDFATLARMNGQDGTAQTGGDLGYFKNNGAMVKPFENAIFGFSGEGLLPSVVETDFGYHVVKVTEAKSNTVYKLATIAKVLDASEATRNELYQKAETIRSSAKDIASFKELVQKESGIVLLSADRLPATATSLNTLQNAREIISWSFGEDVKVGDVSDRVFEIGDSFVIAAVKEASDKDNPTIDDFRTELSARVRNEQKGKMILEKLAKSNGTLQEIAASYGAGALLENVTDINFANGLLNSAGLDATALGKFFGQKAGKRSKPFVGDNGVFIAEVTSFTPAPAIADYSAYKEQVFQKVGGYTGTYLANMLIRENANIKDNRAKFF